MVQSDVPIEITTTRESKLELEGKIIKVSTIDKDNVCSSQKL